jgi:hypothetical protein
VLRISNFGVLAYKVEKKLDTAKWLCYSTECYGEKT